MKERQIDETKGENLLEVRDVKIVFKLSSFFVLYNFLIYFSHSTYNLLVEIHYIVFFLF